jgi:coiled-coil domain-containing protein 102
VLTFAFDVQLEKLQAENAQEWSQREKLSSEKLALERENKKLRSEIARLEEELSRQSRSSATSSVADLSSKATQEDIAAKTKVLY